MADPAPAPVAVIPARGGSKRIPRKNVRPFRGKPMIAWPISAARASGLFARIVVTTDDDEIATVARAAGAEAPFVRDADLAGDHAGTTEVIADAVARLGLGGETPVCCLYATAAFVTAEDLAEGLARLRAGSDWVLTLAAYRTPIQRAYRREGARFVPRDPAAMPMRSQDLEPAYFDAAQFYWARAARWATPGARMWDGAAGLVLDPGRVVDIDTPEDWALAEAMHARAFA